jgi:hypothetical protein
MALNAGPEQGRGCPHAWARPLLLVRVLAYAAAWFPCFWYLASKVPGFGPVFRRLAEHGELPWLSGAVLAVAEFDAAAGHAPALLAFLGLLGLDELVLRGLAPRPHGKPAYWVWFAAVVLAGAVAAVVVLWALLLPVYTMASTVE